jgi:hypothetical protein
MLMVEILDIEKIKKMINITKEILIRHKKNIIMKYKNLIESVKRSKN